MKKWSLMALWLICSLAQAGSPAGRWITVDDKTQEKRAIVEMKVINGELTGKIIQRFLKPGDPERCVSCPMPFTDKPIQDMVFIWGLKKTKNGHWEGGKLIDPRSGRIYRVKVTEDKGRLYVRGYIGLSVIGRTQVWLPAHA